MQHASKAYALIAKETASPRELEATLLLKAAAKMQAAHDKWDDKSANRDEAVLYNRRLWTVFIDAVMQDNSSLPVAVRQNLANLGVFVMDQTFSLMTNPRPSNLASLIKINREIAAGLRGNG
ncbi:MAG TPA: flagellar biosynthesis regulator FlaF [Xanthobacteraceae bacterium]|jgi:flagellar protein FlaF